MRFQYSFYIILLLPFLAFALHWWKERRQSRALQRLVDTKLIPSLVPNMAQSGKNARLARFATFCFFAALAFVLLRPQYGFTWRERKSRGVDLVVALDVSESMLAADISPSRLERARRKVFDLSERLKGDRIGLIVFAGTAFIECPLTLDYSAFRLFLSDVSTESVPVQGTNLQAAFEKSLDALGLNDEATPKPSSRSRAVLLITDGEDLEGGFEEVKRLALEHNVKLFIWGIGTSEGAPIPTRGGYKKDQAGAVVMSRLNETALADLALKTGGIYVQSISSNEDTLQLYDRGIKQLFEDELKEGGREKIWNEYFQIPLLIAIVFFVMHTWTISRKRVVNISIFLFALFYNQNVKADDTWTYLPGTEARGHQASEEYKKGDFGDAEQGFKTEEQTNSQDFRFPMGRGSALYRQKKYDEATTAFLQAASKAQSQTDKAKALYNAGNSYTQANKLDDAIHTYEDSLKLNSQDKDTQENLAYVKRLKEQQKQQQQQSQKQEQKDQQENQQNQQQSQSDNQSSSDQQQSQDQQQQGEKQKEENKQSSTEQNQNQNQNQQEQNKDQQNDQQQNNSDQNQSQQNQEDNRQSQEQKQNNSGQESDNKQKDQSQEQSQNKGSQGKSEQDQKDNQERSDGKENEDSDERNKGENSQNSPEQQRQNENTERLLSNIQESKGNLQQFRLRKAQEELKQQGKRPPSKDW